MGKEGCYSSNSFGSSWFSSGEKKVVTRRTRSDHLGDIVVSGSSAVTVSWPVIVDPLVAEQSVVASCSRPLVGVDPRLAGIVVVTRRLATGVLISS